MDIGKHKDNYEFYEGFEDEAEIIISIANETYHFWNGYFEDIFGAPKMNGISWIGFTRDYNELINAFSDNCIECVIEPEEYIKDLELYVNQDFTYEETSEVLSCLINILKEAEASKLIVLVKSN